MRRTPYGIGLSGWLVLALLFLVGPWAPGMAFAQAAAPPAPAAAPANPGNEAPRPLTERGVENLAAFTRLLGYIRYFHPSDQAAAADWTRLALAGVQRTEGAADPEALAKALREVFQPIAPTIQIFPSAAPPAPLPVARPSIPQVGVVAWKHYGVGVADPMAPPSMYSSRRVDDRTVEKPAAGYFLRILDAKPFRGRQIRFRAAVRTQVEGEARAQVLLSVFGKDRKNTFEDNGERNPVRDRDWQPVESTGEVAQEADQIYVGVSLPAGGQAWIDDVSLEVLGDGAPAGNQLSDPGFEGTEPGNLPAGWTATGERKATDYVAQVTEERPHGGRRAVRLAFNPPPETPLPRPEDVFAADLGGGVSARFPLAVWADEHGTLPAVPAEVAPPAPDKPAGFAPSGNDRTTRLADVALAWNVFQHFYPYFDVVETDWPGALRQALRTAATDPDETAFVATLDRLGAALHDGHVRVAPAKRQARQPLPILWELVEGRLTVTEVGARAAGVTRGSVVERIDGRPVEEVLREAAARVSFATPQWRDFRILRDLLYGEVGERVRLDLLSPEGQAYSAELERSAGPGGMAETRPEKIAEVRPGILYVDLGRSTAEDFDAAEERLAQARGIVFDMRGYPRFSFSQLLPHLTDSPLRSASWDVPIPVRPDREGLAFDRSDWSLDPAAPRFKGKLVFLTDGRAISAAETLLGIVEAYKLGEIVGGPTAGTNGNVNPFPLPGGYSMSWTGMRVLKQDGSRHHGVGIRPTVPVARTLRGVAAGRDEVLEKGIEIVSR